MLWPGNCLAAETKDTIHRYVFFMTNLNAAFLLFV